MLLLFAAFMAVFQWRSRQLAPADDSRFNALQVALALLAVAALLAVVAAVARRPAGSPRHANRRRRRVRAAGWFIDQSQRQLPRTGVLSVPLWWYKLAMLAWALWLSFALTGWIKWAWQVFTYEGLWRHRVRRPVAPRPVDPGKT